MKIMNKTKIIKILLISFSVLIILLVITTYTLINYFLPYSPIRPVRLTHYKISKLFFKHTKPEDLKLKYDNFDVNVAKNIWLDGWFIYAETGKPKGTILLMHGISSSKESQLNFADSLTHYGYNCILFDSRAHGESGGLNCTFGYYEKYDVIKIITEAMKRYPDSPPYGIYGCSLGAAIAIQTMAIDKRIKCSVVESPFSTLRETVYHYWYHMSGLIYDYIPEEALKNSEKIAHFRVDSVKPEKSAFFVYKPVMVVFAEKDRNIPYNQTYRVYKNLKSPIKEFYGVKGADHYSIIRFGGTKYFMEVKNFFDRNLK